MNIVRDASQPLFPLETVRDGKLIVFEIEVIHMNPMGGFSRPKKYDAVIEDNNDPKWVLDNRRILGSLDVVVRWKEKTI
jgi:hypothetical protein